MKKILLFIAIFAMGIYITKAASVENTTPSTILSNSEAEPQALEAIVAKDYSSDETRNFTIYGTKEANGKWFFYIPYKGVNYGVRWSNENRCFYVYIDYTNWYFKSTRLELQTRNNNNGF